MTHLNHKPHEQAAFSNSHSSEQLQTVVMEKRLWGLFGKLQRNIEKLHSWSNMRIQLWGGTPLNAFCFIPLPRRKKFFKRSMFFSYFWGRDSQPKNIYEPLEAKTRLRRRKALRILLALAEWNLFRNLFIADSYQWNCWTCEKLVFFRELCVTISNKVSSHTLPKTECNKNFAVFVINTMQFEMTFAALASVGNAMQFYSTRYFKIIVRIMGKREQIYSAEIICVEIKSFEVYIESWRSILNICSLESFLVRFQAMWNNFPNTIK